MCAMFAPTPLAVDAGATCAASLNSCLSSVPRCAGASLATAVGCVIGVEGLAEARALELLRRAGDASVAHGWASDGRCVSVTACERLWAPEV